MVYLEIELHHILKSSPAQLSTVSLILTPFSPQLSVPLIHMVLAQVGISGSHEKDIVLLFYKSKEEIYPIRKQTFEMRK